jgi:hypothetical protein
MSPAQQFSMPTAYSAGAGRRSRRSYRVLLGTQDAPAAKNFGWYIRSRGNGLRDPCRSGFERQRVVNPYQGVSL